jgi:hypothetical protein
VPVPQIDSEETFAQVQAKLDTNKQGAARNTRHQYLLRALVSYGTCRLLLTVGELAREYGFTDIDGSQPRPFSISGSTEG